VDPAPLLAAANPANTITQLIDGFRLHGLDLVLVWRTDDAALFQKFKRTISRPNFEGVGVKPRAPNVALEPARLLWLTRQRQLKTKTSKGKKQSA
jgi:hypothetical protein